MTLEELKTEKQSIIDNYYKSKTDQARLRKLLANAEDLDALDECNVKKQIYDMKLRSFEQELEIVNRCISELFPEEYNE